MSECPICGREAISDRKLCAYHSEALDKIREAYNEWERAMEIDWETYLVRLLDEESAGKWVREVVENLMQQDDS